MIRLGLTSYGEHESLTGKKRASLYEYAAFLPLVEIDTAYYGIPKVSSVENWSASVPKGFRFVVKVYSGISRQSDWQIYYQTETEMITAFLTSMKPLLDSGKLFTFLLQFSASFSCTQANIQYLKQIRVWFAEMSIAIELRSDSWYDKRYVKKMLAFMKAHQFSLVVVDEPQVPMNSVPFFPYATNDNFVLFRLHGRNNSGWKANDAQWRKKRTLYRYNKIELQELSESIEKLSKTTKEVGVIFNNNSGGDAADNLTDIKKILKLDYDELNPKQIQLF